MVVEGSSFNSNPSYFQDGMPALKSPPSRRTKFTDKQKQYLNVKFQIGERTGKKAEPTDKGYNCLLVLPAHCTHNDYRHIACRIKSTFVGKNSD